MNRNRITFLPLLLLIVSLCTEAQCFASGKQSNEELEQLVAKAQEYVYSNPRKLDSLVQVIENKSLALGDSSYFATVRSLQGIRATMQNDYGPALKYFYDVWKRSKRIKDTNSQIAALMNMSGVCQMSGRYRDAKGRLQLALELTKDRNGLDEAQILMAIGMAEVELNQFDSAITNFKMAVKIFDRQQEEHYMLSCMSELGYALESQHKYREALDIYKRMDVLYQFTNDATGKIVVNQRRGHTLMHLGRMKEAVEALEYSLVLSDSMRYENQLDSTLLRLVKANAALGNIGGAEKYTKRLMAFIKEREFKKNQELIAFVEAKYNLEEKSRVNDSLASELKAARADLSKTQLYLRFAIAALVVLFLSILVMFKRLGTVRHP